MITHSDHSFSATREQILDYDRRVRNNQIPCTLPCCVQCQTPPEKFKRHETRPRTFLIIEEQLIKSVSCLVIRWKCTECKKTFTSQPDFALPYKRYTLPTILGFCWQYGSEDALTYRGVCQRHNFGHEGKDEQLAHTTVHQWMTTAGSYLEISRSAVDLILQKDPLSTICREISGLRIAPQKHRSSKRKQILINCIHFLHIEIEYRILFFVSIFPILATRIGFT